jgi:hypothetical protein
MRGTASVDRERQVLELWEETVGVDRWQRDNALLGREAPAPRGLGARNRALLALRNTLFNRRLSLRSVCPACATESEFTVDCIELAAQLGGHAVMERATVEWSGRTLKARPPTVDDLIAIADEADSAGAARALLVRCIDGAAELPLDEPAIERLEGQLEALDPAASISFQVCCVACDHEWSSPLDVGEALSAEVQRAAERILIEIDALARAYGWSESEVMQLTPVRRAAYLQLVEAV